MTTWHIHVPGVGHYMVHDDRDLAELWAKASADGQAVFAAGGVAFKTKDISSVVRMDVRRDELVRMGSNGVVTTPFSR